MHFTRGASSLINPKHMRTSVMCSKKIIVVKTFKIFIVKVINLIIHKTSLFKLIFLINIDVRVFTDWMRLVLTKKIIGSNLFDFLK